MQAEMDQLKSFTKDKLVGLAESLTDKLEKDNE